MNLEQKLALESIEAWAKSFGRPHLDFACHAAFPLALTPDLLYHMWVNFQRDVNGRRLEVPWMAVPDLLLSALCHESSGETYRMEEPVRDELLRRLARDERFGSQRVQELAEFLRAYVRRQQLSDNRYEQQFAEAQRLTALAYTDPGALVAVMADAYESGGLERNHLMRLDALLQSYAGPLTSWVPAGDEVRAEFERLQQYGANMGRWVRGEKEPAAEALRSLAGSGGRVRIAQRTMPLPQEVGLPRTPAPRQTYRVDLTQPGTFSARYHGRREFDVGGGPLHWNEESDPELWTLVAQAMRGYLGRDATIRLGQKLFERLVPDAGQFQSIIYREARAEGADVDFVLEFDPEAWPEIITVPWELMATSRSTEAGVSRIAAAPGFTVVRTVRQAVPGVALRSLAPDEALRVLIAWGSATNLRDYELPPMDVGAERREIASALARHGDAVTLSFLAEAQPGALYDALMEQRAHVVHLRAYTRSRISSPTEPPSVALLDDTGEVQWVDVQRLQELLSVAEPALVLLDVGQAGVREYNAVQLMAAHFASADIPAVVAFQLPLPAQDRQSFFFHLYQGLLHEMPAPAAVQAARRMVAQSDPETAAFAAPLIYMRRLHQPLFARSAAAEEVPGEAEAPPRTEPRKFALLIGHTRYKNGLLGRIAVPGHDVTMLAAVLTDPAIGGFDPDDVTTLFDAGASEMRRAISDFMADRLPDDLLFLYIAGAGLVDPGQQLYLAAADSDPAYLWETFVSAADVQREMNRSRAQRQLLVLDCTNVAFNTVAEKGSSDWTAQRRLLRAFESAAGREEQQPAVERVVLAASDGMAYLLEGGRLNGESPPSYFTRYLVDGLGTGAADLDGDGQITADELYEYVLQRTREQERYETPAMSRYGLRDPLVIARSGAGGPTQGAPGAVETTEADETIGTDEAAPPLAPPLDVSAWVENHTQDFTNREQELAQISEWVRSPEAPPLFLVVGEPGSGKTALASRLVQISNGQAEPPEQAAGLAPGFLGAVHFCYRLDSRTLDPRTFVHSLAIQLANRFPEYREAVAPLLDDISLQHEPADKAIYPLIIGPLSRMERDLPVIIAVDALDEALRHEPQPTIVDLLERLLAEAPPRTLCVLATTRQTEALDRLKGVPQERLILQPVAPVPRDATGIGSSAELDEARKLLDELIHEVREWEGTVSGGTPPGRAEAALKKLRETRFALSNPMAGLTALTPSRFREAGVRLDPRLQQQLESYDYYALTVTVLPSPARGARFQSLEIRLFFPTDEVWVQSLFPQPRWRRVLQVVGGMKLALNGSLEWEAGVSADRIREITTTEGAPQAGVMNENELASFVLEPNYRFEIGRAEFEAEGAGDPLAIWRLHNPELQEGRSLQFALLFRTPPGAQQVQMGAIVFAEPDMRWLTGEIGHLFGELPERFRRLFTQRDEERTGAQRLPIGVHESWSLHLPRREEARPEAQSQTAAPAELEEQIVQALLDCAPADDPVAWAELVEEMNRFGWGGLPPAAESAEERVRGTVRAMSSWMTPSGFSMLSEFLFHVRSQTEGDCYARLSDLANSV